jgi:hypothetical protein
MGRQELGVLKTFRTGFGRHIEESGHEFEVHLNPESL